MAGGGKGGGGPKPAAAPPPPTTQDSSVDENADKVRRQVALADQNSDTNPTGGLGVVEEPNTAGGAATGAKPKKKNEHLG